MPNKTMNYQVYQLSGSDKNDPYYKVAQKLDEKLSIYECSLFKDQNMLGGMSYGGWYDDSSILIVIDTNANKPIAFCAYRICTNDPIFNPFCEFHSLFVIPEYRHKGVGKFIFKIVNKFCRDDNLRFQHIRVSSPNGIAKKFYASLGFTVFSSGLRCTTHTAIDIDIPEARKPNADDRYLINKILNKYYEKFPGMIKGNSNFNKVEELYDLNYNNLLIKNGFQFTILPSRPSSIDARMLSAILFNVTKRLNCAVKYLGNYHNQLDDEFMSQTDYMIKKLNR